LFHDFGKPESRQAALHTIGCNQNIHDLKIGIFLRNNKDSPTIWRMESLS
jgi:hypothetical protein